MMEDGGTANGHEETSAVSFTLDQEENTLLFDKTTNFEEMKDCIENMTYTEIEFNGCCEVPVDSFLEIIPSINPNLKSIIICNTYWLNDECLEVMTAYCNKLYKLEIIGCLTQITRTGIESIGRNCSSLLSLTIISREHEETGEKWLLDSRIFPALINNMTPKLRHFGISGFDNLTVDAFEKFFSYFRKTLISLDFSNLTMIDDSVLKIIGNLCTNLFALKLNNCNHITDAGIKLMLSQKLKIEVLELCGCNEITDLSIEIIAKYCPRLTILKLDCCNKITENAITYLSNASRKLSYLSLQKTSITSLPRSLSKLKYLNYLNVDQCDLLVFPEKEIIDEGLPSIRKVLLECDISYRIRLFLLGGPQSGKTSLSLSLQSDQCNVADSDTFGIPVTMWYPFMNGLSYSYIPSKWQEDSATLSIELWDCSGRKALDGLHANFMNMRSIYIVTFNLTLYNQLEKIVNWVSTIQAKAPGSFILIVGSHNDLTNEDKIKEFCTRVMTKIADQEANQVREITEELLFLRDLGLFSMIGSKRRRLEWLLEKRPKIHPEVLTFSSIANQGVAEIRQVILSAIMNDEAFLPYPLENEFDKLYQGICTKKKENIMILLWKDFVQLAKDCGICDYDVLKNTKLLTDLGVIMFPNQVISRSLPNFNASNSSNLYDTPAPLDDDILCINPPYLADSMALLHRDDENPQDLLNTLVRAGFVDSFWSGKKPYDWTLRKVFNNIIANGMIRESIIPLLMTNVKLSCEQYELVIHAMQQVSVLTPGAPNATYDVELVVPGMKNLSVYKRYFLPFQGTLPVIPQVNAWLPRCPDTHVQVGWDYRFISSVPPKFFRYLTSICTKVKESSEILSYWQSGAYIRNGEIDICISQWKDKLVLQVLARTKIVNGARQAVNRAWCCLTSYFHVIECAISLFPGLYYEVLAVNNNECKPILEVIDEFEASDMKDTEVLWFIPLKGCTRSSIRSPSLPSNYTGWIKSISEQNKVHISHPLNITKELKGVIFSLQAAGYEVTTDETDIRCAADARLVLIVLNAEYLKEDKLATIRNNIKEQKILLALFEEDIVIENHGYEDILLNKTKVDLSAGTGEGASYQADPQQLKSLVESCHVTVFGHGSLGEENKRVSVQNSSLIHASSFSLTKKPFEQFAEIIDNYSTMNAEMEIKQVAATAVAAAVAAATAEHIAKQSNPTMGAKAAAMAAEVADAVAKGDSERAAKAIIATAKSVDEVVAFSNNRQSVTAKALNGVNGNAKGPTTTEPARKSTMCVLL